MSRHSHKLEEAKRFYQELRLADAYNILRRYYDRIPFKVEKEHAEYVGMFARILAELGKSHELAFYLNELERVADKTQNPEVRYALGVVYLSLPEPRWEGSRRIFEQLVKDSLPAPLKAKAKLMLAYNYDTCLNDTAACRNLVDSIDEKGLDSPLVTLVQIWKAKILRDESKLSEAEAVLKPLLSSVRLEDDWYGYFSVRVVWGILLTRTGRLPEARAVIDEVRSMFELRHFKSIRRQLEALERELRDSSQSATLSIRTEPQYCLRYEDGEVTLKEGSPAFLLFRLLWEKSRPVAKSEIVQALYQREYRGSADDSLIYYHVHSLRKRLRTLGLDFDAISHEEEGYRLVPKIEVGGGDSWEEPS